MWRSPPNDPSHTISPTARSGTPVLGSPFPSCASWATNSANGSRKRAAVSMIMSRAHILRLLPVKDRNFGRDRSPKGSGYLRRCCVQLITSLRRSNLRLSIDRSQLKRALVLMAMGGTNPSMSKWSWSARVKNALFSSFLLTAEYHSLKSFSHWSTSAAVDGRGFRFRRFLMAQAISSARSSIACCFFDQRLNQSERPIINSPKIVKPGPNHTL